MLPGASATNDEASRAKFLEVYQEKGSNIQFSYVSISVVENRQWLLLITIDRLYLLKASDEGGAKGDRQEASL